MIYREKSAHMMSLAEYFTMIILKYDIVFKRERCFTSVFTGYGVLDGIILIVIYSLLTVVRLM